MGSAIDSNVNDLLPPPYTFQDSHTAVSRSAESTLNPRSLDPSGRPARRSADTRPVPSSSTRAYFEQRPYNHQHPSTILEHLMVLGPGTSSTSREGLDFPQPEDRYRARDVTINDWTKFVDDLLLTHYLGAPNESSDHDRANEKRPPAVENGSLQLQESMQAVIAEWNRNFFSPRGIHIYPEWASSRQTAARSAQPSLFPPDHHHHHRSTSTSSSTSSSSSAPSIASADLTHTTPRQLHTALSTFRSSTSQPHKSISLSSIVHDLRHALRSPDPFATEREAHVTVGQRTARDEVRGAVREAKRARRDERRGRREGRRARRHGC